MAVQFRRQVERYKSFLGIQPDAEVDAVADELKRRGDFTDPPSFKDFVVRIVFLGGSPQNTKIL